MNPITSSTIMATSLSGFPINQWLRVQSPLFIVMTIIGFIISRRFIEKQKKNEGFKGTSLESMKGGVPILVTVILTIYEVPIWGSLLTGIFIAMLLGGVKLKRGLTMFRNGVQLQLVLAIISILYLRDMIVATGSVNQLFQAIIDAGIPILAIAIFIPLFIGVISGSPAMGVGIAFPTLLPLMGEVNIHLTSIIFLGIICTYITSPLHLCTVLTNNYFKSDLNKVLRYLAPSSFALYLAGLAYHLFLYMF